MNEIQELKMSSRAEQVYDKVKRWYETEAPRGAWHAASVVRGSKEEDKVEVELFVKGTSVRSELVSWDVYERNRSIFTDPLAQHLHLIGEEELHYSRILIAMLESTNKISGNGGVSGCFAEGYVNDTLTDDFCFLKDETGELKKWDLPPIGSPEWDGLKLKACRERGDVYYRSAKAYIDELKQIPASEILPRAKEIKEKQEQAGKYFFEAAKLYEKGEMFSPALGTYAQAAEHLWAAGKLRMAGGCLNHMQRYASELSFAIGWYAGVKQGKKAWESSQNSPNSSSSPTNGTPGSSDSSNNPTGS